MESQREMPSEMDRVVSSIGIDERLTEEEAVSEFIGPCVFFFFWARKNRKRPKKKKKKKQKHSFHDWVAASSDGDGGSKGGCGDPA